MQDLNALHEQYQAGKVILNQEEKLHCDLQKLLDTKGDQTSRHLSTALKNAKKDRDHNRTGTTKLRVEMSRAQAASQSSSKTKKSEIKKVGDRFWQTWTSLPQSLAAKYQADRAKPTDVYLQIRHVAVEEPETIEHQKMVRKLKQYRDSIPDKPSEDVMRKFINNRLELIEKVKHKETYTKAFLLKLVTTILSPEDKEKVKAFLQCQEQSRSMSYLADANRMQRLQQAYERSGKEGLLSLNVKSKEFQNCFAKTQNSYERSRSGFAGAVRGRNRFNQGQNRNNNQNNRQNSGQRSNDKPQNQQNNNQQNGNGFTKRTGRKRKRNNNNNNSGNNNSNANTGRAQGGNNGNNNGSSKSLSPEKVIIPKYDVTKIPAGLSNWADESVDPKVRQLIEKHLTAENLVIKTP